MDIDSLKRVVGEGIARPHSGESRKWPVFVGPEAKLKLENHPDVFDGIRDAVIAK